MALNVITAKFCSGSTQTWTEEAYQLDYGQVLQLDGLDLPDAYQVHFSNTPMTGETITQIGGADGVTVPDQYFTTGETIYAWVYLHEGEDDGETVYMVTIPVKKRPQPSDDVPTPVEQSAIDQAIAALNIAVERAVEAITHYPTIIDGTWHVWDVTEEEYVDTGVQAQGEQGQPGADGQDGQDGFSPEVTVTDITGGHRVTITDAEGTQSFDVLDGSGAPGYFGICESTYSATTKIVPCEGFELVEGARIIVRFTAPEDASISSGHIKLNVNNTGAKSVKYKNATGGMSTVGKTFCDYRTYEFVYDGTYYIVVGDFDTNTTYLNLTKSAIDTGTDVTGRLISAKVLHDALEESGGGITVDDELSTTSTNPVQNKVITGELNDVKADLSELDEQINGSGGGGTVDVTSSVQWVSGGSVQYDTGGIDSSATNYSHADIPLNGAVHVSGYTRAGQEQSKGMCFLNAQWQWISGDYHAGASSYDWNYSFDVPTNATILRISCATSRTTTDFRCYLTFPSTEGLEDRVNDIENTLDAFAINNLTDVNASEPTNGQVLVYNSSTGKWENADNSANVSIGDLVVKWIDGYYVNRNNFNSDSYAGLISASATQSMAVIDITAYAGGKLSGHTRLGDDQGIGFYDGHGVFISGVVRPSGTDYEWDFENLSVPRNAKTVIISCKTTSKSLFTVSASEIVEGINNSAKGSSFEYDAPTFVYGLDSDKSDFHYDSQTRLQDVYDWFDILKSTFPRNITKVDIGDSTTPEGTYATIDSSVYDINAYVIQGDNYISGNDFIIASGIHGDESSGDGIQSVVSVAYFIRDMLFNPNKSKFLSFMKWNCKVIVIPVMNPWGYQNGKRCNGRGVDCNRNFDLNFVANSMEYGYSSGTAAFSENESLNVKNFIVNNYSTAKYCTELHTRGGNTLPSDDRWYTRVSSDKTSMQNAVTQVGYYLRRLYGGTVANNVQALDAMSPTFRAYVDQVIGIPTNLVECAKSVNMDIATFNSDSVQIQYVQYLGAMTQKLVETFIM